MVLDFGALTPEINSGLMYAGPGSASMTGAAAAWNTLAAELNSAALGYDRVLNTLSSEEWLGQASTSMVQAVTPYVEWMRTTAAAVEDAASQAMSAATAFETAHATVVPPPVIAANRRNLTKLLSMNVLGQNAAAIAALEAQYAEMWATDSATMYNYAGRSASSAAVKPFTSAPQATNPDGAAQQSNSVAAATGTTAGTAQNTLRSRMSQIISALGKLSTGAQAAAPGDPVKDALTSGPLGWLGDLLTYYAPFSTTFYNTEGLPFFSAGIANTFVTIAKSAGALGGAAGAGAAAAPAIAAPPAAGLGLSGLGAPVAGALGGATSVGRLSVPARWGENVLAEPSHGAVLPAVSNIREAPDAPAGNVFGGMPLAGTGVGAGGARAPRYGVRPTVVARPPAAG
ncbi:PPE family protein [Mycobacterium sherrisii]|uniref:PPE family protein n=1 Tax=Mycobacterium sherrisii TaxID=243061 RepID=UPI003976BE1F